MTSDNYRFLRIWHEVNCNKIGYSIESNKQTMNVSYKWYPLNKGGEFRKWYGNRKYVINWFNDGFEIRNFRDKHGKLLSRPQNTQYNFKQALTWSKITSRIFGARFCEGGFLFDDSAAICYHVDLNKLKYILAFLNTKPCQSMLSVLNPTLNIQIGDIGNLPVIESKDSVDSVVNNCIALARADWDSFETSWDFKKHPMV